ncbi:MAG: hypothetical protein IKF36_05690 [Bacilli bacterium]|nr:hypothetical protein [Bacilli bacterium]
MYVDLILLLAIVLAVFFFFKRFSSFIYLICSLDILYRLLHFLADNLKVPELSTLIRKYIPASIPNAIGNYVGTNSIIYTIVLWCMFFAYCALLFYIIRILAKRKYR